MRYISWTEPMSNLVLFSAEHTSSKGFVLFHCALPSDGTLQESYYVPRQLVFFWPTNSM